MAVTRVLIIGAGVAGLEAALALRALASERVSVEVLAPEEDLAYRPLAAAKPFRAAEVRSLPLGTVVGAAGAELIEGRAISIDPDEHAVTTTDGRQLEFDLALVAAGATAHEGVTHALTFRGPQDEDALEAVLDAAAMGAGGRRIVFAMPAGVTYLLPLYELALLSAEFLADRGKTDVQISLVTPEPDPLSLFGSAASEAIRELFEIRGIDLTTGVTPVAFTDGAIAVVPNGTVRADVVVSLARVEGARIGGLDYDGAGFVRTTEFGRVDELDGVYAAGDITAFPIKQGGIASQQADAAAESMAAHAGAPVEPQPFRPVLRGLLLTGIFPRFLYAEPGTATSIVNTEALWWPPAKIAGKYLAPFLARRFGLDGTLVRRPGHGVPVERAVDPGNVLEPVIR